ncbi:MAG: hypothetical protein K2M69_02045 [Muribaculaceae bacterium]|nr:hypothetical protein [Muribaculaceae bacterium]
MLIDCSYFAGGSRYVLNATLGAGLLQKPEARLVPEMMEGYIEEFQEPFLKAVLGPTLGNKVHCYLVSREDDEKSEEMKGYEAVCERLREAFADYVFYEFLRYSATQATVSGLVRIKNSNTAVSPMKRMVRAWNNMVERNRDFHVWSLSEECPVKGISVDPSYLVKINSLNI